MRWPELDTNESAQDPGGVILIALSFANPHSEKTMVRTGRRISSFWTIQLLAWPAYGVVSAVGTLPYVGLTPHLESVRTVLFTKLGFVFVALVASGFLRRLYQSQRFQNKNLFSAIPLTLSACYLAGLGATAGSNCIRFFVSSNGVTGGWAGWFGGAINASAIFLAWTAVYFASESNERTRHEQQAVLRANALAQQAQLEMLRGQVNPHFLFNSLNSIQALIQEAPERAQIAVSDLAAFLRYSLEHGKAPMVKLAEEICVVQKYLTMEQIRFEEKLNVSINVNSPAENFLVPSLLFHPLIENALKYGMQTGPLPLEIHVNAECLGAGLRVEIANTGRWVDSETRIIGRSGNGLGLALVRERLAHSYRHARLTEKKENGWVTFIIEIGGAH
jgi:two-component system, LytTR family, sensor kinase